MKPYNAVYYYITITQQTQVLQLTTKNSRTVGCPYQWGPRY